jgi:hypothetical protein
MNLARLTTCLATLTATSAALAQPSGADVPRQVVIRVVGDAPPEALAQAFGAQVIARYEPKRLYVLQAPANYTPANVQAMKVQLENDARVSAAEQNRFIGAPEGTTQSFFVYATPPLFPTQPSPGIIGVPQMDPGASGEGVRLAVLDTGFSPHVAILNPTLPGYNFVESSTNTLDVGNGVDDDNDGLVDELAGHGTFVAGLASLIAPRATIIPITVLNSDGLGTTFTVAAGLYHAADAGADVINLSFATPRQSTIVDDAVAYASALGIALIAAAGNDASSLAHYPAACPDVISVAATLPSDEKAGFSNYGPTIDLCAPGVSVVGTLPGDLFAYASGTSFAAAWVSGTLAAGGTLQPVLPRADPARLLATALTIDATNPGLEGQLGAGRLNAGAAFPVICGTADFDGDGDAATDADIEAFFACLGGSCCQTCFVRGADFNGDGDSSTDADIEAFFRVLSGQPC